ncbi:hypothetical protein [Streptomyces bobili]|uniref:hypothetical protein n=1 Tax=Streptomyces bobili TaxID=67280 RepID=UPI0037F9CB10
MHTLRADRWKDHRPVGTPWAPCAAPHQAKPGGPTPCGPCQEPTAAAPTRHRRPRARRRPGRCSAPASAELGTQHRQEGREPGHHGFGNRGDLDGADTGADPTRTAIVRKLDQLREAQQAGQLAPAWDPVDVLALVNQIATTRAAQPEIGAVSAEQAADPSVAARRAAVVDAVERLFPRVKR